jgi:RNA polymerase sigma-70 factor (ECF subfamily)
MEIVDWHAQALRSGDRKVFSEIYYLLFHRMILYAYKQLLDPGDAEDCVSKAFTGLWKKREDMESAAHIINFLYKALDRRCINANKSYKIRTSHIKKWHKQIDQEDLVVQQEHTGIWRTEIIDRLRKQLENLPPSERKVLELYFLKGKSKEEIAQILNKSPNNVLVTKIHALNKLKLDWLMLLFFTTCLWIRFFRWTVTISVISKAFFRV